MALKDIFKMIKADRYTADGCEEIKKAQEAIREETADAGLPDGTMRHRKDGDYVKQAGKWVPAKKGNGGAKKNGPDMNAEKAKHAEARKDRESAVAKQDLPADLQKQAQDFVASATPERVQRYIKALRTPFSIESDSFKEPEKLANALEIALKEKTEGKPEKGSKEDVKQRLGAYVKAMNKKNGEFAGRSKKLGESSEQRAQERLAELNRASAESKPEEKKPALKLPDENSSFATDVNRMKKLKKEDYKQYTIQLEKLHSKYPINKWKDLYNKTLNDSAPRQLTGDCKVRIKKS